MKGKKLILSDTATKRIRMKEKKLTLSNAKRINITNIPNRINITNIPNRINITNIANRIKMTNIPNRINRVERIKSTKRILLMNDFTAISGGAENYFYNLERLLKDNGHEVECYFSAKKPKLNLLGSIFSIKNLIGSYRKICNFKPDIIHIHKYNLSLSLSPLIAARLLGKKTIKTIVTFHDFGLLCANQWCVDERGSPCSNPTGIKWVFKKSLSKKKCTNKLYDYIKNKFHLFMIRGFADVSIGPSEAITLYLRDLFDKDKVKHLPYFISSSWKFRKKRWINKRLLFIARLEREKGLEFLIRALEYLDPDIKLNVIGKGSEEERIKKMVEEMHLDKRVKFLGELQSNEIQRFYHTSDIVIIPSIWLEQFGIVGLEAMASGTPIIASNIGGTADWLHDRENGILVPTQNPKKIAEAVNKLLSNENLIKTYAAKGRNIFKREFTEKIHYKRLIKIYRENK